MQIIPSLLVKSKTEFLEQLRGLHGCCKLVQLDIADGKFVPNKTWADPKVVAKQKQNFELHLMVNDPEKEIQRWKNVKNVKRILIHVETIGNLKFIIYNLKLGLAINPETPISKLKPYLKTADSVQFMSIHPGFQGQKLIPKVLKKIKKFKTKYPNIFTEIDGAVNEETLLKIIKTGVDAICPGSAIFGNERTPEENIKRMREIIDRLTK